MNPVPDRSERLVAFGRRNAPLVVLLLAFAISGVVIVSHWRSFGAARWAIVLALAIAAISLFAALMSARRDNEKLTALAKLQRDTAASLEQAHAQLLAAASKTRLELQDASRLLAAAVARAPLFVWSQDRNLVYRWIGGQPLGFSPERLVGKRDEEILPKSIRKTVIEQSRAVIDSGQPRSYELSVAHRKMEKWYDIHLEPIRDEAGAVNGVTGVAIDITDRKRREQTMRLMMREASHRSKNILAVVQAIARQTAATTPEPGDFAERFAARLEAFGATHALLVDEGWIGADMGDLIRSQIGHYAEQIGKQIVMSGPPLRLSADASQNIGLALHELATNAAKYGALSTPSGRVDISWRIDASGSGEREVALQWIESNGPPVSPPTRNGFGQVILERTVARALNGSVELKHNAAGLSWKLVFPLVDVDLDDA